MKDVIGAILPFLRNYAPSFLQLIVLPYATVKQRLGRDDLFLDSYVFLSVSVVLSAIVMQYILFGKSIEYSDIVFYYITGIVQVFVYGTMVFAAWRIYGSRVSIAVFLVPILYISGAIWLGLTILGVLYVGVLNRYFSSYYEFFIDMVKMSTCTPGGLGDELFESYLAGFEAGFEAGIEASPSDVLGLGFVLVHIGFSGLVILFYLYLIVALYRSLLTLYSTDSEFRNFALVVTSLAFLVVADYIFSFLMMGIESAFQDCEGARSVI